MPTRNALRIAAGIAAFALVNGTVTTARAEAFRHRDATGDVFVINPDKGIETFDRRKLIPDIGQFTVIHERWKVRVAVTLRSQSASTTLRAYFVTSKGDKFQLNRFRDEATGNEMNYFFRNDERVSCAGIHTARTTSGVVAHVPTRCLDNPWKVRVGVITSSAYSDNSGGYDDALRTRVFAIDRPSYSPWIAR